MRIEYRVNKLRRDVPDSIGAALVRNRLAIEIPPEAVPEEIARAIEEGPFGDAEISPRTGLPKRRYQRRDMRPEE